MIDKCLFPVAGLGTRFLPATKSVPKEMFPVMEKPLIEYSIDEAYDIGIRDLVFIINDYKDSIRNYLEHNPYLESILQSNNKINSLKKVNQIIDDCQIRFVNQNEALGLGHAVLQGREMIGETPFAVLLPDDLCYHQEKTVLDQMIDLHNQFNDMTIVAIEEVSPGEIHKYGVIEGDLLSGSHDTFLIKDMIEKPLPAKAPSNLAIIGRYILQPEIFDILQETPPDHRGEIQITDALRKLAKRGKVLGYKFVGDRLDCGTVKGYVKAINYFFDLEE